ncbi:MAG: FprA family A-type flavoprotein [Deltaproteobacteria bacterium]|nr:FprA family A-type flavoprotein [Deltaproteobacteria bacterium]
MKDVFKAVTITDHVYWVGAIDWNIRDFHGYTTRRGSTYNAYLVMADKVTLVDTVKAPFMDEMWSRIASIVDPSKISYIISNHSEMDHSGSLPGVLEKIHPEKVFASSMGAKTLRDLMPVQGEIVVVKDGETVRLGDAHITFFETRMLHWPDSMFSYLHEDRLLFSQDAFGMHLATSERFDDEIDPSILEFEGATYYANILLPHSPLVLKLLDRVGTLGYRFDCIAPDHGPVWRTDINGVLDRYARWAQQKPTKKALVVYDTMWHSTEHMAQAITEGLLSEGISVRHLSLAVNHRSDVAYEILNAGALITGAPTLNNNLFPSVADVLTYLKGLRPVNLIGAAFGSYGWSGESVSQVESILREMGVEIVCEAVKVRHMPDGEFLTRCYALGVDVAKRLNERVT